MKEQMEEMLDAKLKDSAYLHQTMVDLVKAADENHRWKLTKRFEEFLKSSWFRNNNNCS